MSGSFKDLKAYQLAYELAMQIFQLCKHFPKEENMLYQIKYEGHRDLFALISLRVIEKEYIQNIL